jgi:hypothetical protein
MKLTSFLRGVSLNDNLTGCGSRCPPARRSSQPTGTGCRRQGVDGCQRRGAGRMRSGGPAAHNLVYEGTHQSASVVPAPPALARQQSRRPVTGAGYEGCTALCQPLVAGTGRLPAFSSFRRRPGPAPPRIPSFARMTEYRGRSLRFDPDCPTYNHKLSRQFPFATSAANMQQNLAVWLQLPHPSGPVLQPSRMEVWQVNKAISGST